MLYDLATGRSESAAGGDAVSRARILVLDDERLVRRAIARELKEVFDVELAGSFGEAMELLDGGGSFDAIVADRSLGPGPCGLHFLEEAREWFPDAVRLMASGRPSDQESDDALHTGLVNRYLVKPWSRGELLATVVDSLHVLKDEPRE